MQVSGTSASHSCPQFSSFSQRKLRVCAPAQLVHTCPIEQAMRWYNAPEYAPAKALRFKREMQKSYGLRVLDGDLMIYQDARRSDKYIGCLSQKCPSTLFLCGDHSGEDHHTVSINVRDVHMFRSNAPVSDNRSSVQETQPSTRILLVGAGYAG